MARTVPDRILELYDGPAEPIHALRIISDDISGHDFLRLYLVTDHRLLSSAGRIYDEETTESGTSYLTRWIPCLDGWSTYSSELDPLDRKITTGAVDFVCAYNWLLAEALAEAHSLNKLATLLTWSPSDLSIDSAWEEIGALWITDIRQDGAQIVISARDGRDLVRDKEAQFSIDLPDHPYESVNEIYSDTSTGSLVSLSTSSDNGHIMMSRIEAEGGAGAILRRSNVTPGPNGAVFFSQWLQWSPDATVGGEQQAKEAKLDLDESMRMANASIYWSPDSRQAQAQELDLNRAPDFTLGADDFSDFEQMSTYEQVVNRVLVDVPDPLNPGSLIQGFLELQDSTSGTDLAVVTYPGAAGTEDATAYYREHRIAAPSIGHQFFWPVLEETSTLNLVGLTDRWNRRQEWQDTATALTLHFPELCGFSGSSTRSDANKTIDGTNRVGFFAIQQIGFQGGEPLDLELEPTEIVEATAYATPGTIKTSFLVNSATAYEMTNNQVTLYRRTSSTGTTTAYSRTPYRFGRYTVTRGSRGTTARDWTCHGYQGVYLYIWDVTSPVLRADRILSRHAYGVPRVRFKVRRKLGVQMEIGDFVALTAIRFIRDGRPLGAGGGGTTDIFEVTSLSTSRDEVQVEAAWVRGEGTVTVSSRDVTGRRPRTPYRPGGTPTTGAWSRTYSGTGQTNAAGLTTGESVDLTVYLGTEDQIVTFETDWITFWNDDPGSGGDDRVSIIRTEAEVYYDATGGTLTIRSQSSSVVFGADPGHTYDYAISSLDVQVRVTQVGSGTNTHTWSGIAIGHIYP